MPIKKTQTKKATAKISATTAVTQKKGRPSGKRTSKKLSPITVPLKKYDLYKHLEETTGVTRKNISTIFEELMKVMQRHLGKGGAQQFTLPTLVKVLVKQKPATKKRKGINPFTGEPTVFKAKPARNVLKVRLLKRLKEMVE